MLAKLTRGNQVTIPKDIVRQAGLREGDDYVDVVYEKGVIKLRAVDIEERIPPQAYEKLLDTAFEAETGDLMVADSDSPPLGPPKRKKKR